MVGREGALEILGQALSCLAQAGADAGEVVLLSERDGLTRFANSQIHQSNDVEDVRLQLKAVVDAKEGWATANGVNGEAMARAARAACDIARVQPEGDSGVEPAEPQAYEDAETFDEPTAAAGPEARADAVARAVVRADRHRLIASGALRTRAMEVSYANSNGAMAYARWTGASFKAVVLTDLGPDAGSGYAEAGACRIGDIDVESLGEEAVALCLGTRGPDDLEPGEYVVVLKHAAVATAVELLAMMGASGQEYVEGRSYASGRLGQRITSELVTIADDWHAPGMFALPFDFQGMPRQAVRLIDRGVAAGVLHDRASAALAGARSTGHGLSGGMARGGHPFHLTMAPGDSSVEEMVSSVKRGVLVTRFNYANPVHPVKTVFTGMTKDGTFLIENGELVRPLRNLRFTDSLLDGVFAKVSRLSRDVQMFPDELGPGMCSAPAILTRLNFTGSSV